jgi:hypothetical protein
MAVAHSKWERLWIAVGAVIVLALILWGLQGERSEAYIIEGQPTITATTTTPPKPQPTFAIADCHEDEEWAVVHYQDPKGQEDMHGVSRACVNHEDLFQQMLYPYLMSGELIWEWDL